MAQNAWATSFVAGDDTVASSVVDTAAVESAAPLPPSMYPYPPPEAVYSGQLDPRYYQVRP